jgi:hypothetical protein
MRQSKGKAAGADKSYKQGMIACPRYAAAD